MLILSIINILFIPMVKSITNKIMGLWLSDYYSVKWSSIFLNDNILKCWNNYEIKKILISIINEIKEQNCIADNFIIDFSNNSFLKEIIIDIISENFPVLRINRLENKDNLINFSFWGIKNINDKYWDKSLIDKCLNKIRLSIQENFSSSSNKKLDFDRIIRKNYKNLTIWYKERQSDYTKEESKLLLWIDDNNFWLYLEEVLYWEDIELIKIFKEELIISVWKWKVEWELLTDGLFAFYSSELNSRMNSDHFNFDELNNKTAEVLSLEKEIISKFNNKNFILTWISHKVVLDDDDRFWWINPVLIESVRKNEYIWNWENKDLFFLVKIYLDNLNLFDFIAPYIKPDNLEENINSIENDIEEWFISVSLIENNYKWTLTRTSLIEKSKWKEWLRVFVDIASMWVMNILEFRELARKVYSWEINNENKLLLLDSWMKTTLKFVRFIDLLRKKYPKIELSLWWDEVFIFFQETGEDDKIELLNSIWKSLSIENISWRTTSSFMYNNQEILYNELDNISSISKKIEKILRKITPVFSEMPSLVNVDISDKIRWYILSKSWKYEENLSIFLSNFEEKLFLKEWFNESVNSFKDNTSNKIWNILWDEVPLFTFMPEWNTIIRHKYYFQLKDNMLNIRISDS